MAKRNKTPGRIAQMWQVYTMTRKVDKAITPLLLLSFLGPIAIAAVVSATVFATSVITIILVVVLGILAGLLVGLFTLGKRAEAAAYTQMAGQPGATGAVMTSVLRRGWFTSETPIAVNKNRDCVYRAVGRGGVVLIGEGARSRVSRMVADEARSITRVIPNVPVHQVFVGTDEGSIGLKDISKTFRSFKRSLTKREVQVIESRLSSLGTAMPIPKGIDPRKVRAGKPR
jgi:hypothetical protein